MVCRSRSMQVAPDRGPGRERAVARAEGRHAAFLQRCHDAARGRERQGLRQDRPRPHQRSWENRDVALRRAATRSSRARPQDARPGAAGRRRIASRRTGPRTAAPAGNRAGGRTAPYRARPSRSSRPAAHAAATLGRPSRIQLAARPQAGDLTSAPDHRHEIDKDLDFLAWELRPAALDDLGLVGGAARYVQSGRRTTASRAEFRAVGIDRERLGRTTETNLYRIAQEALNNVAKHARASHVDVMSSGVRRGRAHHRG